MAVFNNYPYGNPYQPYGYNPYGNLYQNNNQNFQQNNQQPQQPQANNYYYVNGVIGAKSFQMQPNQTVMLMDSDNPMCFMKQSNGMGQSTLRYFKLVEVSENDLTDNNEAKQNNTNEYVLKSDFDVLSKKVDDLLNRNEKSFKNENSKGNKVNKDE